MGSEGLVVGGWLGGEVGGFESAVSEVVACVKSRAAVHCREAEVGSYGWVVGWEPGEGCGCNDSVARDVLTCMMSGSAVHCKHCKEAESSMGVWEGG